uniref:Venom protein n=1 Tax=Bursaphelenchus xylophilus TaxID=6326 RepID=A0A1I7SGL2_BURXY
MRATVVLSLLVLISTDICQSDDDLLAPDDNTFEDPNSWSCGSDPLNSKWAGRAITYACIEALPSVNACCESHDECYREKAGRGPCDETFCDCMKRTVEFVCGNAPWTTELAKRDIKYSCPGLIEPINQCCVVHDACYDNYNGPTKQQCDSELCDCIVEQKCDGWTTKLWCMGVIGFGETAFKNARLEGCLKQAENQERMAQCRNEFGDLRLLSSVKVIGQKRLDFKGLLKKSGMEMDCLRGLAQAICPAVHELQKDSKYPAANLCKCLSLGIRPNATQSCQDSYRKLCNYEFELL